MSWNEVTLTESGERLLASMLNGSKLTFTRAVLGSTTVEEEMMPMLTDISSPISAPALISGKKELESGNGTAILIQIRNEGVSETTRMRQIGVFAKSEHNDEVMFGVLQDDIGEEIPAYVDFPQFEISLAVAIAISRTNNIEVIVSPLVFAKQKDLEALKKSCEESFAEIAQAGADGIATHNTDPNAHAELFAKAAAPAPTAFSVLVDAWTELAETVAGCGYSAEIAAEGVTAADYPDFYFDENSIEAAAGIVAGTAAGKVVLYAKTAPATALSGAYFIRKGVAV